MKAISRAIDRFCLKHRRFGIPRLMSYIVFITGAIYIVSRMDIASGILSYMAFHPGLIMRGEVWRLFTWVFIPLNTDMIFTVLMLYFYFFIGITLENEWGTAKFTLYFFLGVLLNIVYGFLMWFVLGNSLDVEVLTYWWYIFMWLSPSFLNLSLYYALAVMFPDMVVRFMFIIPIKIKWMALVNAGFFVYSIVNSLIRGNYGTAFLPLIAILNFILVCGYDLLQRLRPVTARTSPRTISFKKAARKAIREYDGKPYRHKCAVCGKTDADNPELEFRYCSRCEGYHCFCIEHINGHIHFK